MWEVKIERAEVLPHFVCIWVKQVGVKGKGDALKAKLLAFHGHL
jgi:hypothetical protein